MSRSFFVLFTIAEYFQEYRGQQGNVVVLICESCDSARKLFVVYCIFGHFPSIPRRYKSTSDRL